jgi:3,4-dihydroxy 2-butanone 4-phosphate synthase / GTP cyclohydrolase II
MSKHAFPAVRKQVTETFNDEQSRQRFTMAERLMIPTSQIMPVIEDGVMMDLDVSKNGAGPLKTPFGNIWMFNFRVSDSWQRYTALVKCQDIAPDTLLPVFRNPDHMMVRIDSGCETGQLFLDQTCECREQLHETMKNVIGHGEGVIIHIPAQDGRGRGTPFKLSTLYLQESMGLNTIQSAACMAGEDGIDTRTYSGVIGIAKFLGLLPGQTRINLATNNPDKIAAFQENGYVVDNTSIIIPATEFTQDHLAAKKQFLNHKLDK